MTATASPWVVQARGTGRDLQPDLAAVRAALSVLADPEQSFQLQYSPFHKESFRTFAPGEFQQAGAWVQEHADARGIYYCHNPVPAGLDHSVKSEDVPVRRWFFIDVDRNKTQEGKNSATDAEHEAARALALEIMKFLSEHGWPCPLLVDSSNGFHLLYRVDLPNDPETKELLKSCLKVLRRFDGERGAIGEECHDARRIAKLPGTWSRRGTESPERPFRLAHIVHCPETLGLVSAVLLQSLSGMGQADAETVVDRQIRSKNGNGWTVLATAESTNGDHSLYARRALEYECAELALTPEGGRNNRLNEAAHSMGTMIGSNWIGRQEVEAALELAAFSCGLETGETRSTIRSGIEAGIKKPREAPKPREPEKPAWDKLQEKTAEKVKRPTIYTMSELLGLELPPPNWAVPGLMSEGLTILAGKPKLGKSWMALNLAITIAAGGTALGMARVIPGDVLYLSLEDRLRRIQDRARKLLKGMNAEANDRLRVAVEWPRAHEGGLELLREWCESVERPTMIVIDVWAKFRPPYTSASQYDQDYNVASAVKGVGDKYQCNILPLHHCKKAAAEDVVDEISGTLGLAGCADGLLILTRLRTEHDGNLFVTGRDIEEKELAVSFDPETFVWTCNGLASEHTESKFKGELIKLFKANAGAVLGIQELAARLDIKEEKVVKHLRVILGRLVNEGIVERCGVGRYKYPIGGSESEIF